MPRTILFGDPTGGIEFPYLDIAFDITGGGSMQIGFIGAGRVGCSLGRYLGDKGVALAGYYDTDTNAAIQAAEFTKSASYEDVAGLLRESTMVFITTGDAYIIPVWEQIRRLTQQDQILCHCSGALSSDAFSGIEDTDASCCSVHPMLPFSNRFSSYQQLENAFFTIEGEEYAVQSVSKLLISLGNEVCRIDAAVKPKYHAAASILSNQMIAVLDMGYRLLEECGFSREEAVQATAALVCSNVDNVIAEDCAGALTGPIERGDCGTVEKHLRCLNPDDAALYRMLGQRLVAIAQQKHSEKDYQEMTNLLGKGIGK
jgi:predicted short-subunit dehydrogenase-like oxidoreductase (DUF2520 family)